MSVATATAPRCDSALHGFTVRDLTHRHRVTLRAAMATLPTGTVHPTASGRSLRTSPASLHRQPRRGACELFLTVYLRIYLLGVRELQALGLTPHLLTSRSAKEENGDPGKLQECRELEREATRQSTAIG